MRVLIATAVLLATLASPARAATPSTLTYRGDATRDNRITGAPDAPLGVRWAVDLGAPMSYPVVAAGMVFVSVRNSESYGTTLYGLDAATGAVRWTRANPGTYWYGGMTYDAGRLYVLNYDGNLMALAPATGGLLWSRAMGLQYAFDGPPAARDGNLYVIGSGSGGTVYAINGANGATLWTRGLPTGGGSPAVDASSVYVSLVCEHAYAFARDTGATRWEHHGDCTGGGDVTPAVRAGRVYPQGDNPAIFSAASGARVGTAAFNGAIGFGDDRAYVPWNGGVIGVDDPGWLTRWTYAGKGVSGEAPLVAGRQIYVAVEGGAILALDRASGRPVWCASTGGLDVGGTGYDGHPKSHIGAGGGLLFVPAGRFLAAYGPGGAPALPCTGKLSPTASGGGPLAPGPALMLRARREDVIAGRRATLNGTLSGVPGAAGARVAIQADRWPFDGTWRSVKSAMTAGDGTFTVAVRPRRNTRYKATAVLRYLRPRSATVVLACYRERKPDPWGRVHSIDPRCGAGRLVLGEPAARPTASAAAGVRDASARFSRSESIRFG